MRNRGVFFKVNTIRTGGYENTVSDDKKHILAEAHHKSGRESNAARERLDSGQPLYVGIDGWVYGEYAIRYRGKKRMYIEMTGEFEEPVPVPANQRNLYLNGPFMDRLNKAGVRRQT